MTVKNKDAEKRKAKIISSLPPEYQNTKLSSEELQALVIQNARLLITTQEIISKLSNLTDKGFDLIEKRLSKIEKQLGITNKEKL